MSTSSNSAGASGPIFSRLVNLAADGSFVPDLAESWSVSDDATRFEFHLRTNARFHDGEPVTAADVAYTAEEVAGPYNSFFTGFAESIESIETPDDHTVIFNLDSPNSTFLLALAQSLSVVPKHVYEGSDPRDNPANEAPIGSGPFKFVEWVPGSHIELERNDDYYIEGKPYLDRYVAQIIPDGGARALAFQNGDIDYIEAAVLPRELIPELEAVPEVQIFKEAGAPGYQVLHFNTTKPPLDDVRVRRAISHGVNRQQVIDTAYFGVTGEPSVSHIPAAFTDWVNPDVSLPEYDIEAANELLDTAGFDADANGVRFELELAFELANEANSKTAAAIADSLTDIGVSIILVPLEDAAWNEAVFTETADFDMANIQVTSRDDPSVGLARLYTTDGIGVSNANASRYSNPQVDALFEDAESTLDTDTRRDAFFEIQELLAEDLPVLPVVDRYQWDFAGPELRGMFQAPNYYYRADELWLEDE